MLDKFFEPLFYAIGFIIIGIFALYAFLMCVLFIYEFRAIGAIIIIAIGYFIWYAIERA